MDQMKQQAAVTEDSCGSIVKYFTSTIGQEGKKNLVKTKSLRKQVERARKRVKMDDGSSGKHSFIWSSLEPSTLLVIGSALTNEMAPLQDVTDEVTAAVPATVPDPIIATGPYAVSASLQGKWKTKTNWAFH